MSKSTHDDVKISNPQSVPIKPDQIREVVKKRRGTNKWMQELKADSGAPGDNSRYVRYALVAWNLPPIDISDPDQVRDRIDAYFKHCVENNRKPQIVALCNWIGVSRETLNRWVNGEVRSETHRDIIKKAVNVIEEMWADYMQSGKLNPVTGIFLAKNWYGYKDQTDVVVSPNNPYDGTSERDRAQKYLDGIAEPSIDGDGKME